MKCLPVNKSRYTKRVDSYEMSEKFMGGTSGVICLVVTLHDGSYITLGYYNSLHLNVDHDDFLHLTVQEAMDTLQSYKEKYYKLEALINGTTYRPDIYSWR